jgi:hypothetical protein
LTTSQLFAGVVFGYFLLESQLEGIGGEDGKNPMLLEVCGLLCETNEKMTI